MNWFEPPFRYIPNVHLNIDFVYVNVFINLKNTRLRTYLKKKYSSIHLVVCFN